MSREESRQYVMLITDAFETAAEQTPVQKAGRTALYELRLATQDNLRQVDWEALQLPPVLTYTENDEPVMMEPPLYAHRLAQAAFSDATVLIEGCLGYAAGRAFPFGAPSLTQMLKNSKGSLLTVARMKDGDRKLCMGAVEDPASEDARKTFGDALGDSLFELEEVDGLWRFDWKASVGSWILAHRRGGCPADFYTKEGERQTVLHSFWDAMVDRARPEPKKPTIGL